MTSTETTPLYSEYSVAKVSDANEGGSLPSTGAITPTASATNCWTKYVKAVETHPLPTKSATAAIILGSADLAAQCLELIMQKSNSLESTAEIDLPRILRFAAIGLVGAPWSHYYFFWLDRCLPPTAEPWTKTTAVKVCVDQFIQAPLLLAFMITALSLMKGFTVKEVKASLQSTFVDALIANWKLWIPASIINIAFVKPTLRVLFVNVVFFFWTIILSLLLNKNT